MRRGIRQKQLLAGLYLPRKCEQSAMMVDVYGRALFVEWFIAKAVAIYEHGNAQRHAFGAAPFEFRVSLCVLIACALRLGAFDCVVNPAHVTFPQAGGWDARTYVNAMLRLRSEGR